MNRPSIRTLVVFAALLIALVIAASDLLVTSVSALLLVFAGLVFGVLVHALADWPARRLGIRYRYTFGVVTVLIFALIGLSFFYLGSQVGKRADRLVTELQSAVEQGQQRLAENEWAKRYLPEPEKMQEMVAGEDGSKMVSPMVRGAQSVLWGLTGALVILFVGLYAAYDPDLYRTGLLKLFPLSRRGQISEVLGKLRSAMGRWIVARMISMAIVGVLTAVGLWILGVPMALSLGVLAAVLTFIPNIGPILAAVPQVLLALNEGTSTALYVIIFNLALQAVESYVITPMIERTEVTLPPILTISAQLLMGTMFGIIGVMMAAPLVVVGMVLTQTLYIRDRLGDAHPGELIEQESEESERRMAS